MADKGQHGFAGMEEERHREISREGGHASHEKGHAHEFDREEASEAARKGAQARHMAHASRETTSAAEERTAGEGQPPERGEPPAARPKKTRGGTHEQHVSAGKKGGSRIRQLIELGYKYEEEHGIGPGRSERSKLATRRRAVKTADEGEESSAEIGDEAE